MRKRVGKIGRAGVICLSCLMFSGCGGPSEEKIAQAQEAYAQLIESRYMAKVKMMKWRKAAGRI